MHPSPGMNVTSNVRLVRPLREGGMGSVWVADHLSLDTQVAVKFVSSDLRDEAAAEALTRFRREARAAAQIKSPHVVHTYDHDVLDDGTPFIVMELLAGNSLGEWLDLFGTLSLRETEQLVTQVCKALRQAHRLGIVHRDIKPDNLFLVESEDDELFVKVLDFGVAKQTKLPAIDGVTSPGGIVGTPEYMCPEMMLSSADADHRADLWALAVVAYQALTGRPPFRGDSLITLCLAILNKTPLPPSAHEPGIPPAVDAWFEISFDKSPEVRFASARIMSEAFRLCLERPEELPLVVPPSLPSGPGSLPETDAPDDRWAEASRSRPRSVPVGAARTGAPPTPKRTLAGSALRPPPPPPSRRGKNLVKAGTLALIVAAVGVTAVSLRHRSAASSRAPAPVSADAAEGLPVPASSPLPPLPLPPDQVLVAAGDFYRGCARGEAPCASGASGVHAVELDAFAIDRHEVTVARYARCVGAARCSAADVALSRHCNWGRPDREDHPMNCVSFSQARAYCEWAGMQLPSEAQWEKAARGTDGRPYPWGAEAPSCRLAVMDDGGDGCARNGTWPVGSRPGGASPSGALDMVGNVREWVADWYAPEIGDVRRNPTGPGAGVARVVRGGSWLTPQPELLSATGRQKSAPAYRDYDLGFRCARPAGSGG